MLTFLSFDCRMESTVSEAGENFGAAETGEGEGFEEMC